MSDLLFAFRWDSDVPGLPEVTYGPGTDNPFTIHLAPADYRMRAVVIPPNAYVQSIRIGNIDMLIDGLHLDSSVQAPLEIVVAADMEVSKELSEYWRNIRNLTSWSTLGTGRRPTTPESDLYQSVRTDQKRGSFQFEHVPPGDYTIYSSGSVEPTAWMNSNFMREYEGRGKPVHMDAGSRQTIQVEAIP